MNKDLQAAVNGLEIELFSSTDAGLKRFLATLRENAPVRSFQVHFSVIFSSPSSSGSIGFLFFNFIRSIA